MEVIMSGRTIFRLFLLVVIAWMATSYSFGQGADPQDIEAWRMYREYKASRQAEAAANEAMKQARGDVATTSLSTIGVFGSDPADRARVLALRNKLEQEKATQLQLLKTWNEKFFWRFGDLSWAEEKIYDAKAKREMDRIEFALTYFRFDPAKQDTGDSVSETLELPGYWGHLKYTVTGARLTLKGGQDKGFIGYRTYEGAITGSTLTIAGTGVSDNPSPGGPDSGFNYRLAAKVTVGDQTRQYVYPAQVGEKLNRSFSLTLPVKPGAGGSFEITLLYLNANYGDRGWRVSGSFIGSSAFQQKPVETPAKTSPSQKPASQKPPDLQGVWACNDGGSYTVTQDGDTIRWKAMSADNGRTWTHTFVGRVDGDKIIGRFEDQPPGVIRGKGDLVLRIVNKSRLEFVSSSTGFGGRVWSR